MYRPWLLQEGREGNGEEESGRWGIGKSKGEIPEAISPPDHCIRITKWRVMLCVCVQKLSSRWHNAVAITWYDWWGGGGGLVIGSPAARHPFAGGSRGTQPSPHHAVKSPLIFSLLSFTLGSVVQLRLLTQRAIAKPRSSLVTYCNDSGFENSHSSSQCNDAHWGYNNGSAGQQHSMTSGKHSLMLWTFDRLSAGVGGGPHDVQTQVGDANKFSLSLLFKWKVWKMRLKAHGC